MPSLSSLRVGLCGLEVVLSPAPPGRFGWFSPLRDREPGTFVLDSDISLEDLGALAEERWPAWPALVVLGETAGNSILVNLERLGSLSVEGPMAKVRGVLAGIALQLAAQPWTDEMLAGLYALGTHGLAPPPPGLTCTGPEETMDLAEKLDRVADAHRASSGGAALSVLRAVASEGLPNVAIAFPGTPPGALRCLAEAAVPEVSGVALVGAGPIEGACWRLVVDSAGHGRLLPAQPEVSCGRGAEVFQDLVINCELEEVALLSEALHVGDGPPGRPGTPPDPGPTPPEPGPGSPLAPGPSTQPEPTRSAPPELGPGTPMPEGAHNGPGGGAVARSRTDGAADGRSDRSEEVRGQGTANIGVEDAANARGDAEICVLGPVDIVGGDLSALESSRRMAALALLAYLACHPRPVTADELAANLWPLDATSNSLAGPQRKTVMNAISRARAVLGYATGGKERRAYSPMGYRLTPDVTSDWARFDRWVSLARGQQPAQAIISLRRALDLVRGEPFGGALSSQFFEWVASEHLDLTLSAKVVDVAQDLGELALEAGDHETVLWAVDKGLRLEPTREELFRLWMHALGREGRPAKVNEIYKRLKLVLRQRIHPLQEPQPQSQEVWRTYTSAEIANA